MKSAEEFLDTFKKLNSDFSKKRRPLTKLEMNTPTPRTDAHINENMRVIGNAVVCNDFARQLERELVEANKDRDEWKAIAVELAEKLERTVIPTGPSMFRYADEQKQTIARFNAKKG